VGVFPFVGVGGPAWEAMGMLDAARAHFPDLVAYVLCFGVPLGLALGTLGVCNAPYAERNTQHVFSLPAHWSSALWRASSAAGPSAAGWSRLISSR
jgi:hypothetical protein